MKLSKISLGLGIFIVISAAFMQQVWLFLRNIFGEILIQVLFTLVFAAVGIWLIGKLLRNHRSLPIVSVNLLIYGFSFLLAWRQPFFTEKLHVLEYGLLGWLSARDLNKKSTLVKKISGALLFIIIISFTDELFQKFLPYRVGDPRDFFTNLLSGAIGITLFLLR